MKKDPMVLWEPPMAVTRTVYYSSQDEVNMEPGSSRTGIHVWLSPVDPQGVSDLLQAAEEARTRAGYSDTDQRYGGRVDGHDLWIRCSIHPTVSYTPGATYDPHNNKYDSVHIDRDAFIEP